MSRLFVLFFISLSYIMGLSSGILSPMNDLESSILSSFGEDDNTTDRCNDLLNEFALQTSKFTLCAVVHARPIHLCRRCVDQFKNVTDVFSLIHKVNNTKGQECGEVLLNSDRLGVLNHVYDNAQNMWKQGHCQNCFNYNKTTGKFDLSKSTLNFIALQSDAMACINNYTHTEESQNSTVCEDCEKKYCALNEFYNKLKDMEDDAVCMDIVDTMNQTRTLWSDELKCIKRQTAVDVLLILTSCFVSLIPFLFYLGAKLFSNQIRNRVQTQKRLAEHINPPKPTSSNQESQ